MADCLLTNPEAPLASARRLVAAQQFSSLPAALTEPVTQALSKWLGKHPDCVGPAGAPSQDWCEAARQAHNRGHRCQLFRRRKSVTSEAENSLKWIVLACGYAGELMRKQPHKDAAVRSEASRLVRGLKSRRMTWDQATEALVRIRSVVQTRGKKRAGAAPVRDPLMIQLTTDLRWREVVTVRALASLGRANGLCTDEPEYARKLKRGIVRFFALEECNTDRLVGLISVRIRDGVIEGARGPDNGSLLTYREPVLALLTTLGIGPARSADLLGLGLTGAVPDVDLQKPDLVIGDAFVWFGTSAQVTDEDDGHDEARRTTLQLKSWSESKTASSYSARCRMRDTCSNRDMAPSLTVTTSSVAYLWRSAKCLRSGQRCGEPDAFKPPSGAVPLRYSTLSVTAAHRSTRLKRDDEACQKEAAIRLGRSQPTEEGR